jgi:hypothetical protein
MIVFRISKNKQQQQQFSVFYDHLKSLVQLAAL